MISVGVGVQIQYAKADFSQGCSFCACPARPACGIVGQGWGYGFTAGVTVTPTPDDHDRHWLSFGINQKINGTLTRSSALLRYRLPAQSVPRSICRTSSASVCARSLTPQWTALATVEWTNWSRIGTSASCNRMARRRLSPAPGHFPFQYKTAGSSRSAPNISGIRSADAARRHRLTRYRRSPIKCASRCCRTTTASGLSIGGTYQ